MKYKVSLLPEKVRKRLNSKKKAEKVKSVALTIMLMLLIVMLGVLGSKLLADKKLQEAEALNNQYEQKVAALQHYRDINTNLQNKLQLIESIQVKEPSLYNFLAILSNVKQPGISILNIECTEWKTTRNCVVTGSCDNRTEFNTYLEKLNKTEGISSATCMNYVVGLEDGEQKVDFTINIACDGGAAPVAETTAASSEATTAAAE